MSLSLIMADLDELFVGLTKTVSGLLIFCDGEKELGYVRFT
jgi:hypothetical protein